MVTKKPQNKFGMTMTFQALEGHVARSEDVHRHIFRSHLAYLNQEETPAKLEQRHNLESLISEFLSMVPHSGKFSFLEVNDILNTSIENNPNFSAYKAGSAFEALEKYATNLISHPWRKEYKTVKLYSGFYKHSVEQQLLGGSAVFHLLGYQYTEEGVLYLDEPVDPDKAARVALDCLTAYVECQIMVQICERVKSFKCSWQEIYAIRQDYACGVDEAVRILHQLKRNAEQEKQDRYFRNQENGIIREDKISNKHDSAQNYQKTGILIDVSNTWPSSTSAFQGYGDNPLIPQSSLQSGSYTNKPTKVFNHSKLPSWSEGVSSQVSDYDGRNFISKSDETDSYPTHSVEDSLQPNYTIFDKSNPSSRYADTDLTPDSWKDSWELLHSPLQSSSYPIRPDIYSNCDRDSHRTGYNSVPNVKETYSSHFGHLFPSHHMMPMGVPGYPYPLSHDFAVPPRQCQCRMCCEHQFSMIANKYQQKYPSSNHCETNRSYGRAEVNHLDDPPDVCSSFLKLSLEGHNPNPKVGHFPITSPAYSSYQMQVDSLNDVIFRPNPGNKPQQTASKRGSYYDNVPSTFDSATAVPYAAAGTSLNSKCDFQTNGTATCNTFTSRPKSQKGTLTADSSNSSSAKHPQKKNYNTNCPLVSMPEMPLDATNTDSKNLKSHLTITRRDSKGVKKWSCTSCTYYNAAEKSICDMCGRSKNPGPEIAPLVSGGRECPQCTLVNKKDSEDCTACGVSLKDSPTYI